MAKIYEYLKEKALAVNYRNKVYFRFNPFIQWKAEKQKYTFLDLYNAVEECINLFKKTEYQYMIDKPCFMVVNRRFEDIVEFIALMELGAKPIPIYSSVLYKDYIASSDDDNNDLYEIAPSIIYNNGKIEISDQISLNKDSIGDFFPPSPIICDKSKLYQIIYKSINIEKFKSKDFDFAILTSGTTNKSKIFGIKEEDLINSIENKYDYSSFETYICQSPISSISGMLFDIYLPIKGFNKSIYIGTPEHKENLPNPNIILPANFLEHGSLDYQLVLYSSDPHKITLFGGKISSQALDELLKLKKINAKYRKKDFSIINYYGRTENYGLISQSEIEETNRIYLLYISLKENEIIYIDEKRNIYYLGDNKNFNFYDMISYESNLFPTEYFCEIFPIANIGNPKESIEIKEKYFGEIIVNGIKTGDYGVKIKNKIYLVGREEEFIKKNNDTFYYLTPIESIFTDKMLNNSFYKSNFKYCNNYLSVRSYIVKDGNILNLYLDCNTYQDYYDNYFLTYCLICKEVVRLLRAHKLNIDRVFICKHETIGEIFENSKIKKYRLLDINSCCDYLSIHNIKNINKKVVERIEKIFKRKFTINYDEKARYYIFSKDEFSARDLALVLTKFNVLDYKEDKNNYYLGISDDFLFAKPEKETDNIIDNDEIHKYQLFIEMHMIRKCLIIEHQLVYTMPFKIAYSQEGDRLVAKTNTISRFLIYEDKEKVLSSLAPDEYTDDVVEYNEIINLYEAAKLGYNKDVINDVFSIDNDNNFYCNEEKITFDYRTPDLYNMMYRLLIEHKKELKKEGKLCKTLI